VTATPALDFARRINERDAPRAVVIVAGGGTEVFPMLLAAGGGSSTLLSGRIPYDGNDFRAILGYHPGRLVDARAARGLAMAAFRHALTIRGDLAPEQVFGLGATSKLSRGPGEREGRSHEVHAALQGPGRTLVRSLTLPPGGDRPWQERINALVVLNLIALGKGLPDDLPLEHLGRAVPASAVVEERADAEGAGLVDLPLLLDGRRRWVGLDLADGRAIGPEAARGPRLILPGSFRPLHAGHVRMAEVASGLVGLPCDFEMTLFHPEKPPLDYLAVASRLRGFAGVRGRLLLTAAPTYLDKARLFPGSTFAVGHDTALRILEPRFYGGPAARDAMLGELEALGARFLIFGRRDDSGRFRDFAGEAFAHPPVAAFLARNARTVPEHLFRVDLSSTEVRQRAADDDP